MRESFPDEAGGQDTICRGHELGATRQYEEDLEGEMGHGQLKPRWRMSQDCKLALERAYLVDKCPPFSTRERLAIEYEVTPRQVQVWFQNKRQRASKRSGPDDMDGFQALKRASLELPGSLESKRVAQLPSTSTTSTPMKRDMDQHYSSDTYHHPSEARGTAKQTVDDGLPRQLSSAPGHSALSHLIRQALPPRSPEPACTTEAPLHPRVPFSRRSVDSLADLAFVASQVEEMSESLSLANSASASAADLSSLSRVCSLADLGAFCRANALVDASLSQ